MTLIIRVRPCGCPARQAEWEGRSPGGLLPRPRPLGQALLPDLDRPGDVLPDDHRAVRQVGGGLRLPERLDRLGVASGLPADERLERLGQVLDERCAALRRDLVARVLPEDLGSVRERGVGEPRTLRDDDGEELDGQRQLTRLGVAAAAWAGLDAVEKAHGQDSVRAWPALRLAWSVARSVARPPHGPIRPRGGRRVKY